MRVIAIAGPTASGKTRLAVEVAHSLGSEIVSVDSRQVYRGLDIGSGKDLEEYRRPSPPVKAHMIDVADPVEIYTVFHFQKDCYRVLEEAAGRDPFRGGTPLVLAGGSGLYLEAVLMGYRIPDVDEDPELRENLMSLDRQELMERLRALDPGRLERTDCSTRKRIVRALEVALREARGPVGSRAPPPVEMTVSLYAIRIERGELRERIARRLEERLREGLVEEVRRLLDAGLPPTRLLRLGLEYREVCAYLTGEKSYEEMSTDLRQGIFRFARRQEIWFRGMERRGIPVTWVRHDESERILREEGEWFQAKSIPRPARGAREGAVATPPDRGDAEDN
jgi:tRNA dimethylallyltransferase